MGRSSLFASCIFIFRVRGVCVGTISTGMRTKVQGLVLPRKMAKSPEEQLGPADEMMLLKMPGSYKLQLQQKLQKCALSSHKLCALPLSLRALKRLTCDKRVTRLLLKPPSYRSPACHKQLTEIVAYI